MNKNTLQKSTRRLLLAVVALWATMPVWAEEATVASPDGRIVVTLVCDKGQATYSVCYDGRPMLMPSALGLVTSIGDFTAGLTVKGVQHDRVSRHYTMQGTKAAEADYEANSLLVELANGSGGLMSLRFQVSNRDVAFRYELPRQKVEGKDMKRAVVQSEATSFRLPDGTTTFLSPQIGPGTGWEQTKPSYEEEYGADTPMGVASRYGQGYVFPALFHVGGAAAQSTATQKQGRQKSVQQGAGRQDEGWVLISETGVSSSYCGSHLSDFSEATGYTIAYPHAGENNGLGTPYAGIPLPGTTPWRTVTVGQTLLQALDDLLLAAKDHEGVDGTLVELDRTVAVGSNGLEVGLVVLDARHDKALEGAVTRKLDPLGLVIAAGVAAQVRRELDGAALLALASVELALGHTVVELLDDRLHILEQRHGYLLFCATAPTRACG